ncbi:PREDICTED: cilia- and flagella-associated protein 44 [Poecilia mexicana]|nr:PREDICTED: cilia- and flagella-associated protein 44 [Poecilia mexicana]
MPNEGASSVSEEGEQAENTSSSTQQHTEGGGAEEPSEKLKNGLSEDTFYNYEELHSRATITPDSEIPENLLLFSHSFGYDSGRRSNLRLLDETTLLFIAGNLLVVLDIPTRQQTYLRSCSGGGIGGIAVHPAGGSFAVAEKGKNPLIIIYEYPSLRPFRILRGGTERMFSFVDFNPDGTLLASVGGAPDYMLTVWNWRQEEVMLSCKAVSQEVYRVSFSPHIPGLLTSSGSGHIKFWKMAETFTGLKLQGIMGHFGKTASTDIEGYVELPDGKVMSGTDWGNLLLWEGNTIRVEITRMEGRSCHVGVVQPFTLEDGQLMTFGADGAVRSWDFEKINMATMSDSSSHWFELEPINELLVGYNVCLTSVVRTYVPDSFMWFAQDSNGSIWKLDLSFTNTAADPECLFSFHAGAIQGMDVSTKSHLMATTTLDRSVRVFDFVANKEVGMSHFNQGGTMVCWAPLLVNQSGGLLVAGFEDGVVRLLELFNPQELQDVTKSWGPMMDVELRLNQAFKPHNAPVTAVAYDRNGEILATGSLDCTVFFFTVGEKYSPIGFIPVPGPVKSLEWSPHFHSENRLLILCQTGHAVEVPCPEMEDHELTKTFQLQNVSRRTFRFKSIKSKIKRDEEIRRRQAVKDKKRKEREEKIKELKKAGLMVPDEEEEEEEEEELPPIIIPSPPSPLCCGFYSQPGQFWLSMGGFDAGFLYHCKLSADQEEDDDAAQRQDEPFAFLQVNDADDDPICSMTFSSERKLLLCGMQSGAIRVYFLHPEDHNLTSMKAYWALSVHDNHFGQLRHLRCSFDDLFVLTAGDDGNIFSFRLLPPEELQKTLDKVAKIPSPRAGLETEPFALDIEDPGAYSIETAKQKTEKDNLRREAEQKEAEMLKELLELQKRFKQVQSDNESLIEHVQLKPQELVVDQLFYEEAEKQKALRMMEVRKQMAWEQEHSTIALKKLKDWSDSSIQVDLITVSAIRSNHRVSKYPLSAFPKPLTPDEPQVDRRVSVAVEGMTDRRRLRSEPSRDVRPAEEKPIPRPSTTVKAKVKLGDREEEKLRKAAERAGEARAKIQRRKEQWALIYADKPEENYMDPVQVQAIQEEKDDIRDFIRGKQLRVNAEQKKKELVALNENIYETQNERNEQIVSVRDIKVQLVSWMEAQVRRLHHVHPALPADLRKPSPPPTSMLPEEMPEKKLQVCQATLERYRTLRQERMKALHLEEDDDSVGLLEQLEKDMKLVEEKEREKEEQECYLAPAEVSDDEDEESQRKEEIRLLHEQDCLLHQMESSVCQFDKKLLQLHFNKQQLDSQLKLADLRLLTLVQEMLLLKQFDKREGVLQDKLDGFMLEEMNMMLKLDEYSDALEMKRENIARLQEREKALAATFKASLGENNLFQDFLTKVFKKKVKRVKKKETTGEEGQEKDSDESSESESESDEDYSSESEEEGPPFDDTVCPPGCDQELFESTLELREHRLDVEDLLTEEKRVIESLRKENDLVTKKTKVVKNSRKALEDDMELINKEKQMKMNELDVVVPLRLHQIAYLVNDSMPSDLSEALMLYRTELHKLQQRFHQLEAEKVEQRNLHRVARQQRNKLINEDRDKNAKIQELERDFNQLQMTKFGRLVDLEALQMMTGSRKLEELKQEKLHIESVQAKEVKEWEAKMEERLEALTAEMKNNNESLFNMTSLWEQKKGLEPKLNARQKKIGRQQFQDHRRRMDQDAIQQCKQLIVKQTQLADALWSDITLLSTRGGSVLPSSCLHLPPTAMLPTPIADHQTEVKKNTPAEGAALP